MSTYYSYYSTYTSTSYYPTYTTTEESSNDCLSYVYLTWVYFLFYLGAGYPTHYYPYIISTLLNFVPTECGGTGSGGDAGSSISLLSLFQNYQNIGGGVSPLGGGGGSSFVLGGNSYSNGYNGYNSVTASPGAGVLSQYGIQQPVVISPGQSYGKRSAVWLPGQGHYKAKKQSQYLTKKRKNKRLSQSPPKKNSVKIKPRTKPKTFRRKTKTLTTKRPVSRISASLQLSRIKRGTTTTKPKISKNLKKVLKQKKKRKLKRKQKKKGKRKQKKKRKRQRMKRFESSKLAKIPSNRIREFRLKFNKGKLKVKGNRSLTFLSSLEFPYSESGNLRSDFRKIVQQKVINKLPDFCEQAALVNSQKDKEDCASRAKRIRQRITERLKEKYF